ATQIAHVSRAKPNPGRFASEKMRGCIEKTLCTGSTGSWMSHRAAEKNVSAPRDPPVSVEGKPTC
ncbi:hypothetical protein, partial [Mesorhizobium sp. M1C.F.Ca.ET.176.01.1.1]|uniref:hypothetical protein n=1 Tax=Mesorhizobium sp. M1C.F.Ca.ET.176.01.1.1 TaxID=2563922 RepID=UPI001AEDDBE4